MFFPGLSRVSGHPWWIDFSDEGGNLSFMFGTPFCPIGSPLRRLAISLSLLFLTCLASAAENPPSVPRFSMSYVDQSVDPKLNFYQFATGAWRSCLLSGWIVLNIPQLPIKGRLNGNDLILIAIAHERGVVHFGWIDHALR